MPDVNGFLKRDEKICPDCSYTKHGNGRVRRVKICQECRKAKQPFEGNWSEDFTRPSGTTEVH